MNFRLALLFMILVPCLEGAPIENNSFTYSENASITVVIDFGNDTIVTYENLTGTDVLNVTQSVTEVGVNWYGNLAFITSIGGIEENSNSGYYWQYWVNDQYASVAANLYSLTGNETIEWRYTDVHISSNITTTDETSLHIGVIIVCVFGFSILTFLYWMVHRRN